MMLGVVLHTSQIYNPIGSWLVRAEDGHIFFYYLIQTITAFRIPAFFFLSGFFSTMLILRTGYGAFFRSRLRRIAIPLVVTGLTLNMLQTWLLNATGWTDTGLAAFLLRGEWVQHTWFLVNLLAYVGVLTLLGTFSPTLAWFKVISAALDRMPFPVLLVLLPLPSVFLIGLGTVGVPIYTGVLGIMDLHTLFLYVAFFMVGCLVFSNDRLFTKFTSQKFTPLMLWASLALALYIWLPALPNELLKSVATTYLRFSIHWLGVCVFLRLFKALLHRITPLWKALSEASYTVYLSHHFVVVSLGIVFVKLAVPAVIGFVVIVPLTLALTFWLHSHLVARYPALSLLFNGKAITPTAPAQYGTPA